MKKNRTDYSREELEVMLTTCQSLNALNQMVRRINALVIKYHIYIDGRDLKLARINAAYKISNYGN